MVNQVTIDFETRSAANLLKTGAWRYSIDNSTQVLCLAYKFDDEKEIYLWHREIKPHFALPGSNFFLPESPKPTRLLEAIESGCIVEAHNSMFERCVWLNTFLREHPTWPKIKHRQYRCSAAKAAILGLPRSLDNLAHVLLKGIEKDKEGHRLMLQMSKPRKPIKAEKAFAKELGFEIVETVNKHILVNGQFLWWEDEARCKRIFSYCKQDVRVEHACSKKLPDLSPYELEIFLMDQHINVHGITLDLNYVNIALKLINTTVSRLNEQLRVITKDKVQSATSRDKVLNFINEDLAYFLPNLTKEVLEEELEKDDIPEEVKTVIGIRQDVCRTSNAKYKAMMTVIDLSDNRMRNTILYSGAASTGRWCLPADVEVLTEKGWVTLELWNEKDKIAQWSTNRSINFKLAKKLEFSSPNEMYVVKNLYCSLPTTAEHKWPVEAYYKNSKLKTILAKDLKNKRHNRKVPCSGFYKNTFEDPNKTQLCVMVQADGCISKRQYHTTLELKFKKERKILRCERILRANNLNYKKYFYKNGCVGFVYNNPEEWIVQAKYFGSWVLNHNPKIFVKELQYWDGCGHVHKGFTYYSSIKENITWAQTMVHLSGKACKVVLRTDKGYDNAKVRYSMYIRDKDHFTITDANFYKQKSTTKKVYCASTETGYFLIKYKDHICVTGNSGTGVQPHNFPRGSIKGNMADLCNAVIEFYTKPEVLEILFDNIMSLLSTTLRGAIIPPKNKDLIVADYSGIEARILLWIADDQEGLEVFRKGRDIYIDMACSIYKVAYEALAKLVKLGKDDGKRFFGKQAILGLGYQMGKDKFYETILKFGIKDISRDFLANIINIYRYEKYSKVSKLWETTNGFAKEALQNRGKIIEQKINEEISLKWLSHGHFLYCVLPSGRRLHYHHPKLKLMTTSWGEQRYCVTYMSTNAVTRKWERTHTYGGKLIENIVQAIARDIMANGMYNVYRSEIYFPVMTVHDELISEVEEGVGSLKHYIELLCKLPSWAKGLPLTADGWRGKRYHK